MKYYTKNEVIKLTGITEFKYRFYREEGYFKDIKKEKGQFLISEIDINNLISDLNYINNSYTITEVAKKLNVSDTTIRSKLDSDFNEKYKLIFNKIYIQKDIVDSFIKQNNIDEIHNKYITLSELSNDLNISNSLLYDFIVKTLKIDLIKLDINKNNAYIKLETVLNIKELWNYRNNSYSLKDISDIFNVNYDLLQKNSSYFKDIIPNKLIGRITYYDKEKIKETFTKEFINSLTTYSMKKKLENNKKVIKDRKIKNQVIEGYYSQDKCSEILDISVKRVRNMVSRNIIKDYIYKGKYVFISETEINYIYELVNNSYKLDYIVEIGLMTNNDITNIKNQKLISSYFPKAFLFDYYGDSHYRITNEDIEYFKQNIYSDFKKQQLINNEQNPITLFNIIIEDIKTNHIKTFEYYKEFAYLKINSTNIKDMRNYTFNISNTIKFILNIITKELYLYNDKELEFLLKNNISNSGYKLFITDFLKFLKGKEKSNCKFNNTFNRYFYQKTNKTETDIYTIDTWIKYYNYLTNIDNHIIKAFENTTYSKLWLYTLLHLSITWRSSDILDIESLYSINTNKYNIEWFKENEFTLTEGQEIINSIKIQLEGYKAHKNNVKTHFVIYPHLVIPTAIAFIICEKHRITNKEDNLFGKSRFFKEHFDKFFEDDELKGFTNRKANRSLLTYNFNTAVNTEGMNSVAYSLSSYLRSHKLEGEGISRTTAQYIYSTNEDGDSANVSYHLFQRGQFGWLYNTLISLVEDNSKYNLEDSTNRIMAIEKQYSSLSIEGFTEYLHDNYKERKEVIEELITLPKEEIKNTLSKIIKQELPSKTLYTQCLKHNNCPYRLREDCIGCKYSIPMNYTLSILKTKIYSLIEKLEKTNDTQITLRQKYSFQIMKLLYILKEIKLEFDSLEKGYINAFIDLQELQNKIILLQKQQYLLV